MMRSSLLFVLFSLFHLSAAFVVTPSHSRTLFVSSNTQLQGGMAQPETQTKTKTKVETKTKQKVLQKSKVKTGEPVARRDEDFEDAPMYILYLLADDDYDIEHVVTRMCAVMEDLDEGQAANVFQQAQQEGKAMCGKYPFERAELFKEQLLRSDPMIFADMQEENA